MLSSLISARVAILALLSVLFSGLIALEIANPRVALASAEVDWQCDKTLAAQDESSIPVCVMAFAHNSIPMQSTPLLWSDKDGFTKQQASECTEPFNEKCGNDWIRSGGQIRGMHVMPPCEHGGSPKYCIANIKIESKVGQRKLEYLGEDSRVPEQLEGVALLGSEKLNIPRGGKSTYWKDPATNDRYFLSINSFYSLGRDTASKSASNLIAIIDRTDVILSKVETRDWALQWPNGATLAHDTVLAMDLDERIELSMSFPDGWGGFAGARMSNIEFSAEQRTGYSEVQISGNPIEISGANVIARKPSQQWDEILGSEYPANAGSYVTRVPYLSMTEAFKSLTGDKASGYQRVWGLSFYPSYLSCAGKRIDFPGYAASNALFQDSAVPAFSGGFFIFRAGDFHRRADGTVNRGIYYFGIDSDLARCLYGFSRAPISATITVTDADGSKEIAVTQVLENKNLLRLEATNFTYSVKTIRAKITGTSAKASKLRSFSTCLAMNKVYKGGVARAKTSTNVGPRTRFKPSVNPKLYEANAKLDKDGDGISCER